MKRCIFLIVAVFLISFFLFPCSSLATDQEEVVYTGNLSNVHKNETLLFEKDYRTVQFEYSSKRTGLTLDGQQHKIMDSLTIFSPSNYTVKNFSRIDGIVLETLNSGTKSCSLSVMGPMSIQSLHCGNSRNAKNLSVDLYGASLVDDPSITALDGWGVSLHDTMISENLKLDSENSDLTLEGVTIDSGSDISFGSISPKAKSNLFISDDTQIKACSRLHFFTMGKDSLTIENNGAIFMAPNSSYCAISSREQSSVTLTGTGSFSGENLFLELSAYDNSSITFENKVEYLKFHVASTDSHSGGGKAQIGGQIRFLDIDYDSTALPYFHTTLSCTDVDNLFLSFSDASLTAPMSKQEILSYVKDRIDLSGIAFTPERVDLDLCGFQVSIKGKDGYICEHEFIRLD